MTGTGERLNFAAAKLIREARIAQGFSQEALAAASGLDRTYISAIERGKRNISLAALGQILDALGIEAAAFGAAIGQ